MEGRGVFARPDRGDPGIILRQAGGHSVEILLNGAQVVSWKTSGRENLFPVDFATSRPVRGGIRIYFPKIFNYGNLPQPGFDRSGRWRYHFRANEDPDMPPLHANDIFADFSLDHTRITSTDYADWPNRFEFRLRVILGSTGKLSMISCIKNVNTDGRSFAFLFSYQNYLSVLDIGDVRIGGLEGTDYLDAMQDRQRCNQGDELITFDSAVRRVYLDAPNRIATLDHMFGRIYSIEKSLSLPNIAVWNPWNDYRTMVCVEAAAYDHQITLIPGQKWMAMQHLSATELNYNA